MSVLNRTTPAHRAIRTIDAPATRSAAPAPQPLLGGRYVTTRRSGSATEGQYVTTGATAAVTSRGTYVTTANQPVTGSTEGRYTDRG